jgi:hypothetical protein
MWSKGLFSKAKVELHMALEVILRLDVAQENRALSNAERDRARWKRRIIGLAALERSRKRQASRITILKEGDANTRFFHLRVNAQKRKNHILRLKHNNGWVTEHDQKKNIIHSHFTRIVKRGPPRTKNFNSITIPTDRLSEPFLEEVKAAVENTASDKALGPDGYSGAFFKACWKTVKTDLMAVINQFSNLQTSKPSLAKLHQHRPQP